MTHSSEKKVLALKYRPRRFDELIGQKSVSQTLALALDSDKLSHAYLFSGLRGSGKTSTARIFAKALICESGISHNPCEVCENCKSSNIGKHIDIIEMDAASNRKIDDIRDVIEQTRYKPSSARFKIFIVDEVHMLTKEAFNALLKTLEEPPEYVKFILATTDPLKLPATILSRTQHFRFKKISQTDVMNHLKHILNIESIEYDEKALEIIARSGNGSLRDTLTLLDQAIVYSKNYIDLGSVVEMLGILDPKTIEEFFDYILSNDRASAIRLVETIEDYDSEMLIDELMSFLKLKLVKNDSRFPPYLLDRFFRIVSECKSLLAIGSDSGFVFSLAVLKMLEALKTNVIDEEIVQVEQELEKYPKQEVAETIKRVVSEVTPKETEKVSVHLEPKPEEQPAEPKQEETASKEQSTETTEEKATTLEQPQVAQKEEESTEQINRGEKLFESLVDGLYDKNFELGTCFKGSITFGGFDGGTLSWSSAAEGECREMLKKYWPVIKQIVGDIFGVDTQIKMVPMQRDEPTPKESLRTAVDENSQSQKSSSEQNAGAGGSCIMSQAGLGNAEKKPNPEDVLKDPFVEKAIELLEPEGIRIRAKV